MKRNLLRQSHPGIELGCTNLGGEKYAPDVVILTVSEALPLAQARWCEAEGVKKVITASNYKYHNFGEDYGVYIPDLGLLARAVFAVDRSNTITHVEYVENLSAEPDFAALMQALSR